MASVSLSSEDQIDSLSVTDQKETYTVIRDAFDPTQWYYVPDRPRIFEKLNRGQLDPEFQLLKYQYQDPKNPLKALEGGILLFAATMDLPGNVIEELRGKIIANQRQHGRLITDNTRIAPLPIRKASVVLYAPGNGELVGDTFGSGIAPIFASQKMVFSLMLNKIGSDVYSALTQGNTGVPLVVQMTYSGLTPPAGFSVEVNWDQTYEAYSKDSHFAARASYLGWISGSLRQDRQDAFETLVKHKCIKVNIIEGSGFTMEQIDRYLQPILNRINAEIIEEMRPPPKIDPASAPDPKLGGWAFAAGYSVATRSTGSRKSGTEVINFNVRQYEERITIASGFIGIGHYPIELRNRLIITVPPGDWTTAYFLMPNMFEDQDLCIKGATLRLDLCNGPHNLITQNYTWNTKDGWQSVILDTANTPTRSAMFLVAPWRQTMTEAEYHGLTFRANISIAQYDEPEVNATWTMPVFNGSMAIQSINNLFEKIGFDLSLLRFQQIDHEQPLFRVEMRLKSGPILYQHTIKPAFIDGKYVQPSMISWLIPREAKDPNPVVVEIFFVMKGNRRHSWGHNGKNLRQLNEYIDLTSILLDYTEES